MRRAAWILLALATGLLAGCGSGGRLTSPGAVPPGGTDEAQVAAAIAAVPELVEPPEFPPSSPTPTLAERAGINGVETHAEPFYWREIDQVDTRFAYAFSDTVSTGRPTTAVVTINKRLLGSFNRLVDGPGDSIPGFHVIRKPLYDLWTRRVLLKYVAQRPPDGTAGWRVVGFSGVRIASIDHLMMCPSCGMSFIWSVRVEAAGEDTTIADPLAFFGPGSLPRLPAGQPVKLTVRTGALDDVVDLRYFGPHLGLNPGTGDYTYTLTFTAPLLPGTVHVGIGAITNRTLLDEQWHYDSLAWLLPCRVEGLWGAVP